MFRRDTERRDFAKNTGGSNSQLERCVCVCAHVCAHRFTHVLSICLDEFPGGIELFFLFFFPSADTVYKKGPRLTQESIQNFMKKMSKSQAQRHRPVIAQLSGALGQHQPLNNSLLHKEKWGNGQGL